MSMTAHNVLHNRVADCWLMFSFKRYNLIKLEYANFCVDLCMFPCISKSISKFKIPQNGFVHESTIILALYKFWEESVDVYYPQMMAPKNQLNHLLTS